MKNTTLFIKHMVCDRCIRVVKDDIEQLGFQVIAIELGKVEVEGALSVPSKKKIEKVEPIITRVMNVGKLFSLDFAINTNLETRFKVQLG